MSFAPLFRTLAFVLLAIILIIGVLSIKLNFDSDSRGRFAAPQGLLAKPIWASSNFKSSSRVGHEPCNPFQSPGFIDGSDDWIPLDASCPPVKSDDYALLLPHLRNKRYYFYGDSVLRNVVHDFCVDTLHLEGTNSLPNPPGYLTTSDQQAIHYCHIESLNFTVVNIYTFGLKEWDESDLPFLTAHGSINHAEGVNPNIWTIEDRMRTPHSALLEQFGPADAVFLASGLWDLPYLQRYMTQPTNHVPQTVGPPPSFLRFYARRVRDYIRVARELHPSLSKIYYLTLHDPRTFEIGRGFGMEGYPFDNVEFSCLGEPRVRGLREASVAAVMGERMEGMTDVEVLPYDLFLRAAPEDKRMRDDIHPSAYVNALLGTALIYIGSVLDGVRT